jgi:flagellar hook protein FlgE
MDVIGNNIANVNTVGYKSSRVLFQDIYSQTVKPATAASATSGGTNPQQIGLGMQVATIDVMHTKGTPQYTGYALDLSIDGDGYFVIENGTERTYTRAGNFYVDNDSYLVDANGNYVLGLDLAADGSIQYDAVSGEALTERIQIDPSYTDVSIDSKGQITALNGSTTVVIGTVTVATFSNANGLEKSGANSYRPTVNSGEAVLCKPFTNGAGKLNPGTLEMSNVDLTAEFADMIVTQRGFQANSRIITTTDEMLEEIVNMVR